MENLSMQTPYFKCLVLAHPDGLGRYRKFLPTHKLLAIGDSAGRPFPGPQPSRSHMLEEYFLNK